MNSKCPSCNSAIADESAQFCPVCFEVRPAEGWAKADAPGAAPSAPPGRGPDYTPAFSRKRVQTVVESNIDVDAIVQQAKNAERAQPAPDATAYEAPADAWSAPPPPSPAPSAPPPNDVSGGFGAPAPPTPAPPPDAKRGGSSNTMVVMGVVAGLVAAVLACGCCGGFFAFNAQSERSPFGDGPSPEPAATRTDEPSSPDEEEPAPAEEPEDPEDRAEPTPDREPPDDSAEASGPIADLTTDTIVSVLKRDGWSVLNDPATTSNSTFSSTTVSAMKPPKGAAVGLYDYRDASLAKSLERTFGQNPSAAVRREGNRVVSVIIPNDASEAKRVLGLLLGE